VQVLEGLEGLLTQAAAAERGGANPDPDPDPDSGSPAGAPHCAAGAWRRPLFCRRCDWPPRGLPRAPPRAPAAQPLGAPRPGAAGLGKRGAAAAASAAGAGGPASEPGEAAAAAEAVLERLLGVWADLAPGQLAAGAPEEAAVRGLAAVLACAGLLLDRLPPSALLSSPGADQLSGWGINAADALQSSLMRQVYFMRASVAQTDGDVGMTQPHGGPDAWAARSRWRTCAP